MTQPPPEVSLLVPGPQAAGGPSAAERGLALSNLLERLGDGMICFNDHGLCTFLGANAQSILVDRGSLLGRDWRDILPEARGCLESQHLDHQACTFNHHLASRDMWYQCVCCRVPSGSCVYIRNVTESKLIEAQLRAAQERSALAQRTGRVGVFDWDVVSGRVFWTPQLEELYGIPAGSFEGTFKAWIQRLSADEQKRLRSAIAEAIRERRQELNYEYELRRPDGEHRWMTARTRIFFGDAGQPVRMIGTCQDISGYKNAERALRESEQRFRTMGESLPYGVWWCDAGGRHEYVSQSFLDLLEMDLEQVRNGRWVTRLLPEDIEPALKTFRETILHGRELNTVHRLLGPDGHYHMVLSRGKPVRDGNGSIIGWVGIHLDIDDRKQMEDKLRRNQRELRALAATLERRVLQRTQELEDKTHRLRRLAADVGNTERRERERLAAAIHDHLQQILVAARMRVQLAKAGKVDMRADSLEKAGKLLDEALQAARSLTTELRPPVLYEDGLIAALQWLAGRVKEQFQLDVELELSPDAEPRSSELRSILFESARELLFNVSKHAKVSRARVELSRCDRNEIFLAVEDEGVGFSQSKVDEPGGIGLFRIRERFAAMGGQADIESVPGRGTRVLLIVPEEEFAFPRQERVMFEKQTELPAYTETTAVPSGLVRIVVADDHRMVREGLVMILEAAPDISVVGQANDGREAVELVRQMKPDVVVMDVNMPNMNGIEATRIIHRELPDTVVVAVSAYGESGTADSMRSAGAVAYLAKGGEPQDLLLAVRRHAAERVGAF